MLAQFHSQGATQPYREWIAGFDFSLDAVLPTKQFAAEISVGQVRFKAGQPFSLPITLRNTGMCPWLPEIDFSLTLTGDADRLGLPKSTPLGGEAMVFGESRNMVLCGAAPAKAGECDLELKFRFTCRTHDPVASKKVKVKW